MVPRNSPERSHPGRVVVTVVLAAVAILPAAARSATVAAPPPTRIEVVRDTLHGVVIEDPYRWLEDQESGETQAWLEAQNAHTRSALDTLPGGDRWRARLEAFLATEEVETPRVHGERLFYTRRVAGADELGVLCTRLGADGAEEVLVDPAPLSEDRSPSVAYQGASADGALLAYGLRAGGEDEVEVAFLDVATRAALRDRLPRGRYWEVQITPDGSACYYARFEADGPRVRRHRFGDDPAADPLVFGEGYGRGVLIEPLLSDDGRFLTLRVLHGSAAKKVELYLKDVAADGPVRTVVDDLEAAFDPVWGGGRLYLRTDWEAPNGRVVALDPARPDRAHWSAIVPEGKDVMQRLAVAGGRLFVTCLSDAVPAVRVFDPDGRPLGRIEEPALGTFGEIRGAWETDLAFYAFESCAIPKSVYRCVPSTRARTVWYRPDVPVNPDDFEVKQVWYRSQDGTRVPMLLFARRGLARDGSNPVLLTGHGGFNQSTTARFSALALVVGSQKVGTPSRGFSQNLSPLRAEFLRTYPPRV